MARDLWRKRGCLVHLLPVWHCCYWAGSTKLATSHTPCCRAVSTLLTAPGAGGAQASGGEGAQVPGGGLLDRFARWASRGSADFLVSITMKAVSER